MTEETLSSTWQLIQAVGRAVLVSKKRYVSRVLDRTGGLQAARRTAEATTVKFAEQEATLSELVLKVQLLAEKAERAGELQKQVDVKTKELGLVENYLEAK